jgi:hypothetical protein
MLNDERIRHIRRALRAQGSQTVKLALITAICGASLDELDDADEALRRVQDLDRPIPYSVVRT